MNIAVFFPQYRMVPWSMTRGLVNALRRAGHEVTASGIPTENESPTAQQLEAIKGRQPRVGVLKAQDLIILIAPERLLPWLEAIYGKYEWKQIGVAKASWYQESFYREDYTLDFDAMRDWADEHFFPAYQDAEFFDQESFAKDHATWLPFGVDKEIFRPVGLAPDFSGNGPFSVDIKRDVTVATGTFWPIAFVGALYEKRQAFMRALAKHHMPKIRMGRVSVEDLGGWDTEGSARLYAENLRGVGVFLQLPTMNKMLSVKAYEVMASGTFLLYPMMGEERGASKNLDVFESGKHLIYYRPSNLAYLAQLLRDWSDREKAKELAAIAAAGCSEVRANHAIEKRLEAILSKCGVLESVQ